MNEIQDQEEEQIVSERVNQVFINILLVLGIWIGAAAGLLIWLAVK